MESFHHKFPHSRPPKPVRLPPFLRPREGEVLLFDSSFMHEAYNRTDDDRYGQAPPRSPLIHSFSIRAPPRLPSFHHPSFPLTYNISFMYPNAHPHVGGFTLVRFFCTSKPQVVFFKRTILVFELNFYYCAGCRNFPSRFLELFYCLKQQGFFEWSSQMAANNTSNELFRVLRDYFFYTKAF